MAGTRREALSSRLTGTLQVGPMLAWLVIAYGLIRLLLEHGIDLRAPGSAGMEPMLARLVLFFLLVPLLVLPGIAWWAAGLHRVATDGSELLVTLSTGRVVAVKLTELREVRARQVSDFSLVDVAFAEKTAAGRSVTFLAPTRFRAPRGEEHPVVAALRETVQAARAEREAPPVAATAPEG